MISAHLIGGQILNPCTYDCRVSGLKSLHLLLPAEEAGFAADVLEALGNSPPMTRFCVDFGGACVDQLTTTFLPQLAWLRNLRALRISGLEVGHPPPRRLFFQPSGWAQQLAGGGPPPPPPPPSSYTYSTFTAGNSTQQAMLSLRIFGFCGTVL
jgi:hypothetical protein